MTPKDTVKRVKEALADLKENRRAFLEAVGIPASEAPPAAASEDDLVRLEQKLGQRLPPSYRAFLLIQDGFPKFDGETNLLAVDEVGSLAGGKSAKLLDKMAKSSGEESLKRCIIFGRSDESTTAFLFAPEDRNSDGEWKVIEYNEEEGVDASHESFLAFLDVSAKEAKEARQETEEGQDLSGLDF